MHAIWTFSLQHGWQLLSAAGFALYARIYSKYVSLKDAAEHVVSGIDNRLIVSIKELEDRAAKLRELL